MTTLLALYRRPDGGEEELDTFLRRYRDEHLPLVAATPGLRSTWVRRTTTRLMGEDVVLTVGMEFDDRASLDAGLASQPMRDAGRSLREIAFGLVTLLAVERDGDLEAVATPD